MSNLGFYNAVEANGLQSIQTKVGDRYVLEEMLANGYNFGGEQSGHLIFLDHGTTGDVMSNLGFYNAVEANGLQSIQTKVGDRYVLEEMLANGYNFGGEQSGHLIFLDHGTTGDGLLSAVQLANIVVEKGQSLAELAKEMPKYPQLLKNLRVEDKMAMMTNIKILEEIVNIEAEMNGKGRVLVRPSGTEPLVRVMVEAQTEKLCESYVSRLLEVVEQEMK